MPSYTIKQVSSQVKDYSGQYGPMKEYRVKFEETDADLVIKWSRKADSPAPKAGDKVEGTIDMSGDYGPKFKQDFSKGGGSFRGGGRPNDPVSPYISYAKDLAVALISTNKLGKLSQTELDKAVVAVSEAGKMLYSSSHDSPTPPAPLNPPAPAEPEAPEPDNVVEDIGEEPINLDDIPF